MSKYVGNHKIFIVLLTIACRYLLDLFRKFAAGIVLNRLITNKASRRVLYGNLELIESPIYT